MKRIQSGWNGQPGTAAERGYGHSWKRLRQIVLMRDGYLCQCPTCRPANGQRRLTIATEVDHVVPKFEGGSDDLSNLQAMNKDCHKRKTQLEAARQRYSSGRFTPASAYPDWLEPAACRLTIIFGPPGSGKSKYIDEHRRSLHQVVDLDLIIAELAGCELYAAPDAWLNEAVRARNARLAALAKERPETVVWFPTTAAGTRKDWWIRRMRPVETVCLAEPADVCIRRINADSRRGSAVRARHIVAVNQWWTTETARSAIAPARGWAVDGTPLDPLHHWNRE